jgi:hypothetical protein
MPSTATLALTLGALAACLVACSNSSGPSGSRAAIVNGQPTQSWAAAGYLTFAASADQLQPAVTCSATLIAPNVAVTAAHCVLAQPNSTWGFGIGDVGSSALVPVSSITPHPSYLATNPNPLRLYDIAYLVLQSEVPNVTPAAIPTAKPTTSCLADSADSSTYVGVGYGSGTHVQIPACIDLGVSLQSDSILEVHPLADGALCVNTGDYGSALFTNTTSPVLVGIFVGSVTQAITDCEANVQFLDGYESAFGYADFLQQGILAGQGAAATDAGADDGSDAQDLDGDDGGSEGGEPDGSD